MRIVSLLPSATEILCALGLEDSLVAVTHECDYPPAALEKPWITRSLLKPNMSSGEITRAVDSQLSADAHSLYTIDRALLAQLQPDLIVTQQLCEVCAVSYDEVLDAVKSLARPPQVVNLEPMSLQDVLDDIGRLGNVTGRQEAAQTLLADLNVRIARVKTTVARAQSRPRVGFLEWIDPLFCGGHWNPELVETAGGYDAVGRAFQPAVRIGWERIVDFAPEVLVISCCGFTAERARQDLPILEALPGYAELPCVRSGRVHVVDGAAYFSRPGPRLVDSLEMLARFVHPELYAEDAVPAEPPATAPA
jgi:iron complex transport system substrate-binding protein